jgi:adenylate kinase
MQPDRRAWFGGRRTSCAGVSEGPARAWRMVVLGGPGTHKETQAQLLGAALGACLLSVDDLWRVVRTAPQLSQAGEAALSHMRRGELVPDETVLAMVLERWDCLRCRAGRGFMLDGFPRTVTQAETLERLLHAPLDAVISYELPSETIRRRPAEGSGDGCAGGLEARTDEDLAPRLGGSERGLRPLRDFYRARGLLVPVSAGGTPQDVLARTLASPPFAASTAAPATTAG